MEKVNKLNLSCSVIIPAININKDVIKCIKECTKQKNVKVKIYLVTNKKIPSNIKFKKVKFLHYGDVNMSLKRNKAVKKSKDKYIAFIDSDAYPTKNWLQNGIKILKEKKEIGMITGPDLPFKNQTGWSHFISLAHKSFLLSGSKVFRKNIKKSMFCKQASSCNMIMKKDVFDKAKGMDEKIYIGEDKDLCDRVNRFSKILYSPKVLIHHRTRDFIPFILQRFSYGTCLFDIIKNNKVFNFNNIQYFIPLLITIYYFFLPISILGGIYLSFFYSILILLNTIILIESLRISFNPVLTLRIFLIIKLNIISFGLGSILNFIGIKKIKKIYTKR